MSSLGLRGQWLFAIEISAVDSGIGEVPAAGLSVLRSGVSNPAGGVEDSAAAL